MCKLATLNIAHHYPVYMVYKWNVKPYSMWSSNSDDKPSHLLYTVDKRAIC